MPPRRRGRRRGSPSRSPRGQSPSSPAGEAWSPSSRNDASPTPKKERKRIVTAKREKGFVASLWINRVSYEFGKLCTFCENNKAVVHCPDCEDFLCLDCDREKHRHKKRMYHVRSRISKYDLDTGTTAVQNFFRYVCARKELLKLCRQHFKRYYSHVHRAHYYCKPAVGAESAQWDPPICLGTQLLCPYLTFTEAAMRIQACVRSQFCFRFLVRKVDEQFDKLYDRGSHRFYYFYKGRSPYLARVQWFKPVCLHSWDIRPRLTRDMAAVRIQNAFRGMVALRFVRDRVRQLFTRLIDPITGDFYFERVDRPGDRRSTAPLLGSDHWDTEDLSLLSVDEMCILIRRLGLKHHVNVIRTFKINGALFCTFEWEDFEMIGIPAAHEIKKILLRLQQSEWYMEYIPSPEMIIKRNAMRHKYKMYEASIIVQRAYRRYYCLKEFAEMLRKARMERAAHLSRLELEESGGWWTSKVPEYRGERFKCFGRHAYFLSARGFGKWDGTRWVGIPKELVEDAQKPQSRTSERDTDASDNFERVQVLMSYPPTREHRAMNSLESQLAHTRPSTFREYEHAAEAKKRHAALRVIPSG